MKLFKTIDWVGQLLLILVGAILILGNNPFFLSPDFTIPFVLVGGWQLLSVAAHFFVPAAAKIKARNWYLILLVITIATGIVFGLSDNEALLGYLLVIIFWTPLLAIFYLVICYKEARQIQ